MFEILFVNNKYNLIYRYLAGELKATS